MPRIPAIVCSAGTPAAVTIVQTLGRRDVPIHALSNMQDAACRYSRYTRVFHLTPLGPRGSRAYENVEEPDELLSYLVNRVERGVLFPGTDANIRLLAKHKQRLLDEGFRLCIPDERVLALAGNKSDVSAFCAAEGFPVPRTEVVDSAADLGRVRDELEFPVVLKSVHIKNHRFVRSREELESCYEGFSERAKGLSLHTRAVAQEWIPGPSDRFVKLYVMCDQSSRVVAYHTLRRLRVHTRRDGSQGDTLIARTENLPELVDRWLPFFSAIRWVGMASMECKLDARDGQYKLIEINPRPWAILKVSVDAGVDIPQLYYRLAQHEPVESRRGFKANQYYIRLLWGNVDLPEPAAALGMLLTGHLSPSELLRVYAKLLLNLPNVTIDVGSVRDPLPTLACIYHFGVRHFRDWI